MHLNDLGGWAVLWLETEQGKTSSCVAFFANRGVATRFANQKGGELLVKHQDGALKRAS